MKRILVAALMFLTVPASAQLNLYPIGKNWGSVGQWQAGINKNLAVGGCLQREAHDGQFLAGPCVDPFVIARAGQDVFHLGAYVMFNSEHANASYGPRIGVTLGPVVKAGLSALSTRFPTIEQYVGWSPPKFCLYLDKVLTFDFGVGYRPKHSADVNGNLTWGPMVKLSIPLDDIYALLHAGL